MRSDSVINLSPLAPRRAAYESLAADWVRDSEGTWWCLQIKGFRLAEETVTQMERWGVRYAEVKEVKRLKHGLHLAESRADHFERKFKEKELELLRLKQHLDAKYQKKAAHARALLSGLRKC